MPNLDRFPSAATEPPGRRPEYDPRAAEREKALVDLRAKLVAVQQEVLDVHRYHVNLIDAVVGMETAIADVDFEMERMA